MEKIKQITIKSCAFYFLNYMIRTEDLNPDLLKIGIKLQKNINSYYIVFITMKDTDYVNIQSVNPLYLITNRADGYIKERNGN